MPRMLARSVGGGRVRRSTCEVAERHGDGSETNRYVFVVCGGRGLPASPPACMKAHVRRRHLHSSTAQGLRSLFIHSRNVRNIHRNRVVLS